MDMREDFCVGEIAVKGKIARYLLINHPIDQLDAQISMRVERFLGRRTGLFLAEAAKLQRVVFATGMHVIGKQIIVGNQMALLGMIPKPAHIVDQRAVMVNQGVVDRNYAILAIAGGRIALEPVEAVLIDTLDIPRRFGQPPVEAGLIGAGGELTIDAAHGLVFGDKQASQILREMAAGWFIGEEIAKLNQQL